MGITSKYNPDYEPERECNTCGSTLWWYYEDDLDHFYCPGCHSIFSDLPDISRRVIEVVHDYTPKYAGLQWYGIEGIICYRLPMFSALTEGIDYRPDSLISRKLTDIWAD